MCITSKRSLNDFIIFKAWEMFCDQAPSIRQQVCRITEFVMTHSYWYSSNLWTLWFCFFIIVVLYLLLCYCCFCVLCGAAYLLAFVSLLCIYFYLALVMCMYTVNWGGLERVSMAPRGRHVSNTSIWYLIMYIHSLVMSNVSLATSLV